MTRSSCHSVNPIEEQAQIHTKAGGNTKNRLQVAARTLLCLLLLIACYLMAESRVILRGKFFNDLERVVHLNIYLRIIYNMSICTYA